MLKLYKMAVILGVKENVEGAKVVDIGVPDSDDIRVPISNCKEILCNLIKRTLLTYCFLPAIHAVMKQAALPAINARKATWAKSLCRSGAMVERAAIWVPIDPGLEKPHKAYVAIVSARFYTRSKETKIFYPCCVKLQRE